MAVQLEDCVDCLRVCFPEYDFVFLFDHSQGHTKKCMGALQASTVGLQFGGEQPIMHDSEITEGCLGPFALKLKVSDIQKIVFQSSDTGPFYLSNEEKEWHRYDQNLIGNTRKEKTMKVLRKELQEVGIAVSLGRLHIVDLQALARQHRLETSVKKQKYFPDGKANQKEYSKFCGSTG